MAFIKHSDGKIGIVVEPSEDIDNEKTSKILEAAKDIKDVDKDSKESESN